MVWKDISKSFFRLEIPQNRNDFTDHWIVEATMLPLGHGVQHLGAGLEESYIPSLLDKSLNLRGVDQAFSTMLSSATRRRVQLGCQDTCCRNIVVSCGCMLYFAVTCLISAAHPKPLPIEPCESRCSFEKMHVPLNSN